MTVFVAMEILKGIVSEIHVFLTPESAGKEEARWLEKRRIHDPLDREMKAQNGEEFLVMECELKP
jgi:hypothetical protein